jgi:formamidopyrimidine-DNA glycosylase
MSFELPEAIILAKQMKKELLGKTVSSWNIMDSKRMQSIGFMNKDENDYDMLLGGEITVISQRGNTVLVKLNNGSNLVLGPEYGGIIRYHPEGKMFKKYHLLLEFNDGSYLTIRLTSMGAIYAAAEEKLKDNYMYKRDFLNGISPTEKEYKLDIFKEKLRNYNRNIKMALVGKDALLVGVSNASFQELIYEAKIHPKMKASELSEKQVENLYNAIKNLIDARLKQGGKEKFIDLYGNKGRYIPKMGPNMKGQNCPICDSIIDRIQHGGGQVYLCPSCQIDLRNI